MKRIGAKRVGAIACLAAIMVMFSATFCFGAESLKVESTYPVDGQKNTTKDNMVVKLYFNNEVGNAESKEANKDTFIIKKKGAKDKDALPTIIKYNPKDPTQAMILVDTTSEDYKATDIKDNSEYVMILSGDFVDNDGNALGEDLVVTFKTLNQGQSTKIYMAMMAVMMVGMFVFTSRSMKHQQAKEQELDEKEEPFNPYKEAKRTGKSVEELVAAHEKEQAKKAAKAARKAARNASNDDDDEEEYNDNYKVKGPKPIAAAGGKYVTGRKAIAEAKAAEIEKRKKQQAAAKKKK